MAGLCAAMAATFGNVRSHLEIAKRSLRYPQAISEEVKRTRLQFGGKSGRLGGKIGRLGGKIGVLGYLARRRVNNCLIVHSNPTPTCYGGALRVVTMV